MTREEMLKRYSISDGENNYREAQRRIAEAMKKGEKYVYLPGKCNTEDFSWVATSETISHLMEDGFDIDFYPNGNIKAYGVNIKRCMTGLYCEFDENKNCIFAEIHTKDDKEIICNKK